MPKGTRKDTKKEMNDEKQVTKQSPQIKKPLTIQQEIIYDSLDNEDNIISLFTGKEINWLKKERILIGEGTYGVVLRYDLPSGSVAVKFLHDDTDIDTNTEIKKVNVAEIGFLTALYQGYKKDGEPIGHPNILSPLDVFHFKNITGIVFPLADTDLYNFSRSYEHNENYLEIFQDIALQVLQGILYIESRDILNNDYKEHNILLFKKSQKIVKRTNPNTKKTQEIIIPCYRAVIADFGLSSNHKCYAYHEDNLAAFTTWWRAPEIDLDLPFGKEADVWAFGVILYQQETDSFPFSQTKSTERLRYQIELFGPLKVDNIIGKSNRYKSIEPDKQKIKKFYKKVKNNDLKDLLEKIFVLNPKDRITLKEVYKHPYFDNAKKRLEEQSCLNEPIEEYNDDCLSLLESRSFEPTENVWNNDKYINFFKTVLAIINAYGQSPRVTDLAIKFIEMQVKEDKNIQISKKPNIAANVTAAAIHLASLIADADTGEQLFMDENNKIFPNLTSFYESEWNILRITKFDIYKSTKIDYVIYFTGYPPKRLVIFWCYLTYFMLGTRVFSELVIALSCILLAYDYHNENITKEIAEKIEENQDMVEECIQTILDSFKSIDVFTKKNASRTSIVEIIDPEQKLEEIIKNTPIYK